MIKDMRYLLRAPCHTGILCLLITCSSLLHIRAASVSSIILKNADRLVIVILNCTVLCLSQYLLDPLCLCSCRRIRGWRNLFCRLWRGRCFLCYFRRRRCFLCHLRRGRCFLRHLWRGCCFFRHLRRWCDSCHCRHINIFLIICAVLITGLLTSIDHSRPDPDKLLPDILTE